MARPKDDYRGAIRNKARIRRAAATRKREKVGEPQRQGTTVSDWMYGTPR